MKTGKTPPHIKLDEKNHVEEPFLTQLEGWAGRSSDWNRNKSHGIRIGRTLQR